MLGSVFLCIAQILGKLNHEELSPRPEHYTLDNVIYVGKFPHWKSHYFSRLVHRGNNDTSFVYAYVYTWRDHYMQRKCKFLGRYVNNKKFVGGSFVDRQRVLWFY